MQPMMENESYTILDDRLFEWLNVGSDRIPVHIIISIKMDCSTIMA